MPPFPCCAKRWRRASGVNHIDILLIPGTSSPVHLRENMKTAQLILPHALLAELDVMGRAWSSAR
jgi:aryl-alcohol dehydrogenase-like predicted oxidoreductase